MKDLRCFWSVALPLLCFSIGCGQDGPRTYGVSGTVSMDGEPLPEGDILFRDPASEGGTYAGKIVDGSYSFESTAGKKTVEIRAMRVVEGEFHSPAPGEPEEAVLKQYIPEEYNTKSTLSAEVSSDGENEFNFDLRTSPP